jgi:hypothetical protein
MATLAGEPLYRVWLRGVNVGTTAAAPGPLLRMLPVRRVKARWVACARSAAPHRARDRALRALARRAIDAALLEPDELL